MNCTDYLLLRRAYLEGKLTRHMLSSYAHIKYDDKESSIKKLIKNGFILKKVIMSPAGRKKTIYKITNKGIRWIESDAYDF